MTRPGAVFGDSLRRPLRLLRPLPLAGAGALTALCTALLVQAVVPALAADQTGRLIAAASRGGTAAWMTPLVTIGVLLIAGQVADLIGSPLRFLVSKRIDGAHRDTVCALAAAAARFTDLEDTRVRADLTLTSADPGPDWTQRTPGQAAVAQLRLLLRLIQAGSCALLLARHSPILTVVLLAVVFGCRAVFARNALIVSATWAEGIPAARRARYWRDQLLDLGTAKEIRILGLNRWVVDRWGRSVLRHVEPVWRKGMEMGGRQWWTFVVLFLAAAAGFLILARDAAGGRLAPAQAGTALSAMIGLLTLAVLDDDTLSAVGGYPAVTALTRLRERLAAPPAPPAPAATSALATPPAPAAAPAAPRRPARTAPLIRLEKVGFRYPGAPRPVLDGCDLEIRPGEVLALVGSNAAGKSTLIKVLTGLYSPSHGRVRIDGEDLAGMDPHDDRRRFAVVFQDFVRYHLSAGENIRLGAADVPGDLTAAVRRAGSGPLLQALPDGLQTSLNSAYDGGVDLSGGQWQHIALTRAMFAVEAGARVLIMDEPTAHLDVRTEYEVFRRLVHGLADVSVVLISHRLSTVTDADRIACLADGRIAETGTHQELIRAGGPYAELFAAQATEYAMLHDDERSARR